jgi:tRNA U34 5-methylaminomethyl-2-thiouridine-forming methyltransferase MnmC
MTYELIQTADGSLSCLDVAVGQLCHNRAGAYTEAVNNYVLPSGLLDKIRKTGEIRILDACYGMGYNSWALINELLRQHQRSESPRSAIALSIVAVEQSLEIMQFLPRVLALPCFDALNQNSSSSEHNIYYRTLLDGLKKNGDPAQITLPVVNGITIQFEFWIQDLRHCLPEVQGDFDAVFHDPFSPQKMPELWTVDLFRYYQALLTNRQGLALTYSTAAAVQGGLQEAGFQVLKTRGLGQKAGATLALSAATAIEDFHAHAIPLEPWEQLYLQSRAAIPYRDSDLSQSRANILAMREQEQQQSSRPSGSSALKLKPVYGKPAS